MTETKPKGALIKFLAECGHWMDCYSLEPTPTECDDCASDRAADAAWDGLDVDWLDE